MKDSNFYHYDTSNSPAIKIGQIEKLNFGKYELIFASDEELSKIPFWPSSSDDSMIDSSKDEQILYEHFQNQHYEFEGFAYTEENTCSEDFISPPLHLYKKPCIHKSTDIYKFVMKHQRQIISNAQVSSKNSALLLLYIGFMLKDANLQSIDECTLLENIFISSAIEMLASNSEQENRKAQRVLTDHLGLTKSKQVEKYTSSQIYELVRLARYEHPEKTLEKIYEIVGNVTETSKHQVKKKFLSQTQLLKKQTNFQNHQELCQETLNKKNHKCDTEQSLDKEKEFIIDMINSFETSFQLQQNLNADPNLELNGIQGLLEGILTNCFTSTFSVDNFKSMHFKLSNKYSNKAVNQKGNFQISSELENQSFYMSYLSKT